MEPNQWLCPSALDRVRLRGQVRAVYERVAADPTSGFHFHTGLDYAVEKLGYDRSQLAQLPASCTARFSGVGNPFTAGTIPNGAVVLDHACGAGMDLLLAARQAGPTGYVIGVDVTQAMITSARAAAVEAGMSHRIDFRPGLFEALPVDSNTIDVLLSNGVLNLSPDKLQVMLEVVRVLKPGGQLFLADVVVDRDLSLLARADADLWAACVSGAVKETDLLQLAAEAGLVDARLVQKFDCFRGTSVERKFGRGLKVSAVSLYARKPL